MKKIFTFLFLLCAGASFGQYTYKDTTFAGMTTRCFIPPAGKGTGEAVASMPGLGELGNGTLANDTVTHGTDNYITSWLIGNLFANGWNGIIPIVNGNHYPNYYVVIQNSNISSAGNTQPPNMKAWWDAVMSSRFAPAKGFKNIVLIGFSAGGNVWLHLTEHQPATGDTSYYKYSTALIDLQGVKPDDKFGATLAYPLGFGHRMKIKPFFYLGIEGTFDESRDIWGRRDNMLDSVPTAQAHGIWTVDGGGAHCCWTDHIQPTNNNLTATNTLYLTAHDGATSNFLLGAQTALQAALRFGDTTLGNTPPICSAGSIGQTQLPTTTTNLTGTASGTTGATISSVLWSTLINPTGATAAVTSPTSLTTGVTGLTKTGNYVFRLVVTDNHGLTAISTVRVFAVPACNGSAPVTYTLSTTSTAAIDLDASTQGWKGGDTVRCPPGVYKFITLYNFSGDPCRPIFVDFTGVKTNQFSFNTHTQYVHFCGLEVDTGSSAQMVFGSLFNHIEIDRFTLIYSAPGSAGMFIKTSPDTTKPESIYPNYQMTGLHIHHSKIKRAGDEAMYIGSTSPFATDAGQPPFIPIRMDSVEIDHMTIDSSGWDGIQLSAALDNAKIHDNTITHWGASNVGSQQAGIILGAATRGDIYNNVLINGTGNAIQIFGYGAINVYNNTIDSAGRDGTTLGQESVLSQPIVSLVESFPGQQINFYGNFVKNNPAGRPAVHFYNDNGVGLAGFIHDNVFCLPSANPATWQSIYVLSLPAATLSNNTLITNCIPLIGPTKIPTSFSRKIIIKHP